MQLLIELFHLVVRNVLISLVCNNTLPHNNTVTRRQNKNQETTTARHNLAITSPYAGNFWCCLPGRSALKIWASLVSFQSTRVLATARISFANDLPGSWFHRAPISPKMSHANGSKILKLWSWWPLLWLRLLWLWNGVIAIACGLWIYCHPRSLQLITIWGSKSTQIMSRRPSRCTDDGLKYFLITI